MDLLLDVEVDLSLAALIFDYSSPWLSFGRTLEAILLAPASLSSSWSGSESPRDSLEFLLSRAAPAFFWYLE